MPEANLHFPKGDVESYEASWETARCVVMQGESEGYQALGVQRPRPP
jgi:hypothetical protein